MQSVSIGYSFLQQLQSRRFTSSFISTGIGVFSVFGTIRSQHGDGTGYRIDCSCLDWTERRHHLGGELGVALFARLKGLGWLVANAKTRAARVTHAGIREFDQQLGIDIPL
jgi:hypothetical protein